MTANDPKSIGILGATFDTPNLGVSALASGALRCLHKRYPHAQLFFLDYEPAVIRTIVEEDATLQVPLVQMRFSKRFWLSNNIVVLLLLGALYRLFPFRGFRSVLKSWNATFRTVCDADMYTAVSGGDSFSDLYGLPRFLYVSLPQILVLVMGKPLVQLPQTYGPFRGALARWIARRVVLLSERAFCRDFTSLGQLMGSASANNRRINLTFCFDMAFGIDSLAPEVFGIDGIDISVPRQGSLVGVNVSGLLYREAARGRTSFGIRSNYRSLMLAAIDYFIHEEGAMVLLVPHVFGDEPGSESDLQVCKEIFAELQSRYPGKLGVARGTYGPNEIRYLIGKCDFFTGSRMHACIAAWSQCIPAVAFAYSDKFLGVLNTIGVESLAADARRLTQEEALSSLRAAYRTRNNITARLEAVIPQVRSTVHHMLFDESGDTTEDSREQTTSEPVAIR